MIAGRPPLLAILGPTASGKSALALALGSLLPIEIISGDAAQVYRGMAIGTGQPTPAEMASVPHHLVAVRDPDQPYSVAEFQADVARIVGAILGRGRLPVLAGGSGLYLKAVLEGYWFDRRGPDPILRRELEERLAREGPAPLLAWLERLDPTAARRIHPADARRLVRALERALGRAEPGGAAGEVGGGAGAGAGRAPVPPYDALVVGLAWPRPAIYRRIDRRVLRMIAQGWPAEARLLHERYGDRDLPSLRTLGYPLWFACLRGELPYAEAVARIQRETRRFAKRQGTWFRRFREVSWLPGEEGAASLARLTRELVLSRWPDWARFLAPPPDPPA